MFKNILIPVDLAQETQIPGLIAVATSLAAGAAATINLLYVDQSLVHQGSYPHLNDENYASHRQDASLRMQGFLAQRLPAPLIGKSYCRKGTAHDQILELANKIGVDAIVMMAKKPGLSSYFIGSNAERVVRHAECSVFVIRI